MNKKHINMLLITVTVFIWGFILYRIIKYSGSSKKTDIGFIEYYRNNKSEITSDTITIEANYRDPFKPSVLQPNYTLKTQKSINPIIAVNKQIVEWPDIDYFGLIKNNQVGTQFGLLSVNNKKIILKKDDEFSDLKILFIYPDSIKVKLEDEIKTIIKK